MKSVWNSAYSGFYSSRMFYSTNNLAAYLWWDDMQRKQETFIMCVREVLRQLCIRPHDRPVI